MPKPRQRKSFKKRGKRLATFGAAGLIAAGSLSGVARAVKTVPRPKPPIEKRLHKVEEVRLVNGLNVFYLRENIFPWFTDTEANALRVFRARIERGIKQRFTRSQEVRVLDILRVLSENNAFGKNAVDTTKVIEKNINENLIPEIERLRTQIRTLDRKMAATKEKEKKLKLFKKVQALERKRFKLLREMAYGQTTILVLELVETDKSILALVRAMRSQGYDRERLEALAK